MAQPIVLVTGANKGIGFETARQLGERGYRVVVGARDAGRGEEAAQKLRDMKVDARAVKLDVGDSPEVHRAADWVRKEYGRLDVLVNNAGVVVEQAQVSQADPEKFRRTFDTNLFGVLTVTQAFLPLLRESPAGRIVNVSSGLGSLTQNSDPTWEFAPYKPAAYNISKAALNMMTVLLASDLQASGIKVNTADPGFTATDINNNRGTQTVAEGSEAIVRLATLPDDGPTGQFFNRDGPVPW